MPPRSPRIHRIAVLSASGALRFEWVITCRTGCPKSAHHGLSRTRMAAELQTRASESPMIGSAGAHNASLAMLGAGENHHHCADAPPGHPPGGDRPGAWRAVPMGQRSGRRVRLNESRAATPVQAQAVKLVSAFSWFTIASRSARGPAFRGLARARRQLA